MFSEQVYYFFSDNNYDSVHEEKQSVDYKQIKFIKKKKKSWARNIFLKLYKSSFVCLHFDFRASNKPPVCLQGHSRGHPNPTISHSTPTLLCMFLSILNYFIMDWCQVYYTGFKVRSF